MTVDHIWKDLYKEVVQENKENVEKLLNVYDKRIKSELGEYYWEYRDVMVKNALKEALEGFRLDSNETPDNTAQDFSAAYRMLAYFMTHSEYQEFIRNEPKGDPVEDAQENDDTEVSFKHREYF